MCVVYIIQEPANEHVLSELEFTPITLDWFGNTINHRVEYRVIIDPVHVTFSFQTDLNPDFDNSCSSGEFVEGLWERDVVEIFIAEDGDSTRYQEFNLAPSGAWWSQVFKDYRDVEENSSVPLRTAQTKSHLQTGWKGSLIIRRDLLGISCEFNDASRLNVCGIYSHDPRTYISVQQFSKQTPDFHLAAEFPPIHRIQC
jgi:hypothetical protein